MPRNPTLLDPVVVAQLGNLHIRARRLLEGLYSGRHVNKTKGTSKEFAQHRPYNPGDDLRDLDWKIFGKTDRLVLKQYDEETSLTGLVVIDTSASMNYASEGHITKLEYSKTLAAAMGTILINQHDSVGLLAGPTALKPRNRRAYLEAFYDKLSDLQGNGVWDLGSVQSSLDKVLAKRGLLIFFSDLMQDFQIVGESFKSLRSRKHDIMVFQILDPMERDLTMTGPILFEDLESGEKIKTEPETIRRAYGEFVEKKIAEASHFFKGLGVEYLSLTTDTPFDKGLGAYLSWREVRL